MYTLGEGGGKLNICGLDHSGSETFIYTCRSLYSIYVDLCELQPIYLSGEDLSQSKLFRFLNYPR